MINTRNKPLSLTTNTTNAVNTDNLGDMMNLTIKKSGEIGSLWTGTLTNFYIAVPISLGSVTENNGTADFTYVVSMDPTVGNEFQNKQTVFDLNFSFQGEDESTTTETTTSDGGGGNTSNSSSTSTGGGNPPSLSTRIPTVLGNFLTPYFPAVEEIIPESTGVVEGVTTEPEPEGEVEGATSCQTCFWWPLLVLQILLTIYYYRQSKRKSKKTFFGGGIAVAFFTYAVFLFINRDCRNGWQFWISSTNVWCRYVILWITLIFLLLSSLMKPKNEEEYE
ncbi:MAG: hypothetical protein WC651_05590, partial [Candidatus Gracilibacteria bacterium]